MIELKLQELVNSLPSIEKLRDAKGLKVAALYKLRALIGQVQGKAQNYEESRIAKIRELGTVTIDGVERIVPEKEKDFAKQMEELFLTIEKIDADPISLKDIENAEGLTVRDMEALDKFIQA